jgi:hypothetical protein
VPFDRAAGPARFNGETNSLLERVSKIQSQRWQRAARAGRRLRVLPGRDAGDRPRVDDSRGGRARLSNSAFPEDVTAFNRAAGNGARACRKMLGFIMKPRQEAQPENPRAVQGLARGRTSLSSPTSLPPPPHQPGRRPSASAGGGAYSADGPADGPSRSAPRPLRVAALLAPGSLLTRAAGVRQSLSAQSRFRA